MSVLVFSEASDAKRTPRPVANARMVPVNLAVRHSLAERADSETPLTQKIASPRVTGMPTSNAKVAPGKPMCARACAANASRRITTK